MAQPGQVPAHWIKHNAVTRIPRRHITMDTEAVQVEVDGARVQTFRCAAACLDHEDKKGRGWAEPTWARFSSAGDLWRWVSEQTRVGRRTVLVAHNLAYDLRIADAFTWLPQLGWSLEMLRLDGGQTWASWKRRGATLSMVDSTSWFPISLDKLAPLVDLTKPALPEWGADEAEWQARCEADVAVLRAAWLRALAWIEAEDLGNWKPTGAGQGWAAFRHKWMDVKILHHGLPAVAELERQAAWTGRCEAWRHGDLGAGRWSEYDLVSAYAQIGFDCDVPVRLYGHHGAGAAQRALSGRQGRAELVRCHVDTPVPVVPCRGPKGIVWPVGSFDTVLWDNEARMAQMAGATVTAIEGWRYETAPALRTWATWVLDKLDESPATFDPVLRLIVKGWSRSLVGRFASRWSSWDDYGQALTPGVQLHHAYHRDEDRRFRLLTVGGRTLAEGDTVDAPDSAVHVMSWIMAEARCRLWAVACAAGLNHVAYLDTDGVLVDQVGSDNLAAAGLPGLRMKSQFSRVEILGPRQLILDGRIKVAGVPAKAVRTGERTWSGEVWRSLAGSFATGESASVSIVDREWQLLGVDNRRAHMVGGDTAPLAMVAGVLA